MGSPTPSAWCPRCGAALAPAPQQPPEPPPRAGSGGPGNGAGPRQTPPQRTLMGVAAPFGEVPASLRPHPLGGTEVIREDPIGHTQTSGTPGHVSAAYPARPVYDPLTDPHATTATIIDVPVFDREHRHARTEPMAPAAGSPEARSGGTLMGVARPGIAPLRPGIQKTPIEEEPPPSYRPLEELGATQNVPRRVGGPGPMAPAKPQLEGTHPLGKRRFDKRAELRRPQVLPKPGKKASSRRPIIVLFAALLLVVGAIATVLLWPSPAPLKAQVRSVDGGAEVFDVVCDSCPNGTVVRFRDAESEVSGGRATIKIDAPLKVGDTPVSFKIDRPGAGRDETVEVPVRVAYRIRPDLTTLEADRPSLQIVIEAMAGAKVELDGEDVPLRDGRAVKSVDVSKDLAGSSREASTQLSRRISFVVRPPDGPEEKGVVAVSVPVLPLTITAPGRAIVTEKQTFLLAGRTSPGAEVLVAGRSLGITKDGSFSQTMNVSSVGATEIEVRAKMKGSAPRLVQISVERVSGLDAAALEFQKRSPLDYAGLLSGVASGSIGKPVALAGEVLEVRAVEGVTTLILSVPPPACPTARCLARLTQGRADLGVDRGAKIRAYGMVAGATTHEGAEIPDVDVAFSITDQPAPGAPSPVPGAPAAPKQP
jgi:hypothetical protein